MGDPNHDNFLCRVVYDICYPPVTNANSPNAFFALNLEATYGSRIVCQRKNGLCNSVFDLSVEFLQIGSARLVMLTLYINLPGSSHFVDYF